MDEADRMLLYALTSHGCSIPAEQSNLASITSGVLLSVSTFCLKIIEGISVNGPVETTPKDTASTFRLCSNIAQRIQNLGFRGELSFHQFLYPDEVHTRELLRFLLEKLSAHEDAAPRKPRRSRVKRKSKPSVQEIIAPPVVLDSNPETPAGSEEIESQEFRDLVAQFCRLGSHQEGGDQRQLSGRDIVRLLRQEMKVRRDELDNLNDPISQLERSIESLKEEDRQVCIQLEAVEKSRWQAEEEAKRVQRASGLLSAENDTTTIEERLERLQAQVDRRRAKIERIKTEWIELKRPLEEKKIELEATLKELNSKDFDLHEKLDLLKQECLDVETQLHDREEEEAELNAAVRVHLDSVNRAVFLRRMADIQKNIRKQDDVIASVIVEIRNVQREINLTNDRLQRTHAVVDSAIFEAAKTDPTMRLCYKALNNIHETFGTIVDVTRKINEVQRSKLDMEVKLAELAKKNFNVDQLRDDLRQVQEGSKCH